MNCKTLSPLFALLIFAAHLNCVLEHGHVAVQKSGDQQSLDGPVSPFSSTESSGCEHATGCICKGATLADEFTVDDFEVAVFCVELFALQPIAFDVVPASFLDAAARPPDCTLPMRANLRCALLQSFLI